VAVRAPGCSAGGAPMAGARGCAAAVTARVGMVCRRRHALGCSDVRRLGGRGGGSAAAATACPGGRHLMCAAFGGARRPHGGWLSATGL
jgi:hypothetical protein